MKHVSFLFNTIENERKTKVKNENEMFVAKEIKTKRGANRHTKK